MDDPNQGGTPVVDPNAIPAADPNAPAETPAEAPAPESTPTTPEPGVGGAEGTGNAPTGTPAY